MANIEFHHILPEAVYKQYKTFIDQITGGDFKLDAAYILVPLPTTANGASGSASAMHSGSHEGLNVTWLNLLRDLEVDDTLTNGEKLEYFKGFHSVFRTGVDLYGDQPGKLDVFLSRLDPAAAEHWGHAPSPAELRQYYAETFTLEEIVDSQVFQKSHNGQSTDGSYGSQSADQTVIPRIPVFPGAMMSQGVV